MDKDTYQSLRDRIEEVRCQVRYIAKRADSELELLDEDLDDLQLRLDEVMRKQGPRASFKVHK